MESIDVIKKTCGKKFLKDKKFNRKVKGVPAHRFSIDYKDKKWIHVVPRKEGAND